MVSVSPKIKSFSFSRNPISTETKTETQVFMIFCYFQTCRNQFQPIYIKNCLKLLKIAYGLVENVLYCNFRCNYKVYRDWWNFIQKIVPIFIVKSFGFGFGFGFTETFGFRFRFRRNRKSGFVGSLRSGVEKTKLKAFSVSLPQVCKSKSALIRV